MTNSQAADFTNAATLQWQQCAALLAKAGFVEQLHSDPLTEQEIGARVQLERRFAPSSCDHTDCRLVSCAYYTDSVCTNCGMLLERCFDNNDSLHDKTDVHSFAWKAVAEGATVRRTPRRYLNCTTLLNAVGRSFAQEVRHLV